MPRLTHAIIAFALLLAGCTTVPPAPAPVATAPTAASDPPGNADATVATNTIAANLALVPNLATLARAVQASDRGTALAAAGSYTLFAPTDAAFGRLAPDSVAQLLAPANRAARTGLIDFHLVAGTLTLADLRARVAAAGGRALVPTLSGEALTVTLEGNTIALADAAGNRSYIEVADRPSANGMIQIVNGVLVPRSLR